MTDTPSDPPDDTPADEAAPASDPADASASAGAAAPATEAAAPEAAAAEDTPTPAAEAAPAAEPEPEPEPTLPPDELREGLVERLRAELGDGVVATHITPGDDLWVRVSREAWREAAAVCKHDLGCTYFDFLSAIDWLPSPFGRDMDSQEDLVTQGADAAAKAPGEMAWGVTGGSSRFQVLARVASPTEHFGITLKADLDDDAPTLDTWIPVYAGADWHEREAYEMYGITFVGHPNLKNIYLPGAFEGNPLRKDFPLLARRVKPWPGIVDVEPMPGEETAEEASDD